MSVIRSPVRLLTTIALAIFFSEAVVMIILSFMPPLPVWSEAILDSTLLILFLSPALYLFVFHPLASQITERKRVEEELEKRHGTAALRKEGQSTSISQSPVQLLTIVALSIFFSEAVVMIILSILPPMPLWSEAIIDSTLLVVFLSPVLSLFVFRPLVSEITERRRAEEELQKHRDHLEEVVEERTAELDKAIEELERKNAERKRIEEELRKAHRELQGTKQYLENLIESSSDAIISTDREGNVHTFSLGAEVLLGYRREEIIGRHVTVLYETAERAKEVMRLMRDVDGTVAGLETTLLSKDGSLIPVLISASILYDEEGKEVGTVGFSKDLRERLRAEEELKRLQRHNELILNSAGEGIYGLDLDGNTTFVNPAAARMIGWEVEDLIGKSQHDILHHSKPDGTPYPREECPIYAAFKDGEVHHVADEVFWRKDGTGFPVEYISTPIRNQQRRLVGAVVTFRDITERKQMEQELLRAEKLASLGVLSEGATHEILNPLNILKLQLHMRMHKEALGPESRQDCREMMEQVERIREIVSGLATFTQQIEAEKQPVLLQEQLDRALRRVREELQQRGIEVVEDFLPASSVLVGNPTLLQQAFGNLLENAAAAMPEGGTLTLQVREVILDGAPWVNIRIIDTGAGIPSEHLSKVFDPFFTTREVGEGKGLGLSVVHGIVEHHGGTISMESTEGEGTTLIIQLPLGRTKEAVYDSN